jgi:hypothetical protein
MKFYIHANEWGGATLVRVDDAGCKADIWYAMSDYKARKPRVNGKTCDKAMMDEWLAKGSAVEIDEPIQDPIPEPSEKDMALAFLSASDAGMVRGVEDNAKRLDAIVAALRAASVLPAYDPERPSAVDAPAALASKIAAREAAREKIK